MNKRVVFSGILLFMLVELLSLTPAGGQTITLYHGHIEVEARSYEYVNIYVDRPGTTISIIAYIYTPGGSWSDIDVEIIRPDGSLELSKQRYETVFKYKFTAYMTGYYKIQLDNSYSFLTSKIVDLAYALNPPPATITHEITVTQPPLVYEYTYTTTVTQPPIIYEYTYTTTVTPPPLIYEYTHTTTYTYTTTAPGIVSETVSSILLVVGLVVGLIAGYSIARRRKGG